MLYANGLFVATAFLIFNQLPGNNFMSR